MIRTFRIAVLASATGLLLGGCDDASQATASRPAVRQAPPKKVEAAPASAESPETTFSYQYNPVAKRDPFRAPDRTNRTVNEECNEPLCQFDLDQLTLVGVVTGMANPFAMVEDPQGRGHIVRRNTRIGRQGGKVSQILRDSVTVSEVWNAPDGKQIINPVSMQLKADRIRDPATDLQSGKTY